MGRKRSGTRQHLFLCAVGLISIVFATFGCAPFKVMLAEQESRAHLQGVHELLRQGDFEGAKQANQKVLALSPKSPPSDAALYSMGVIHIHYANPKKDHKRALSFFAQLQKEFPRSPYTEEAKVWVGVLESMVKAMQIDIEIEEKMKQSR